MTLNELENNYSFEDCCCFTGHRWITATTPEVKGQLKAELETLINKGVSVFLAGGALGFDTVAADTVLELKGKYPFIKLALILPCKNQSEKWSHAEREEYDKIKARADLIHYVSVGYYDGCMLVRNEFMVDHAKYCISFLRQLRGGTYYTVSYAKQLGRELIML